MFRLETNLRLIQTRMRPRGPLQPMSRRVEEWPAVSEGLHDPGKEREPILSALTALCEFAQVSSAARYSLCFPLRFGAGINSGMASVGNAGSGDQTDFSAFGDAVNAAFRIETTTREIAADVSIGQATAELLGGASFLKPSFQDHLLNLKGYDKPATVWAGSFEDLRKLLSDASGGVAPSRADQVGTSRVGTRHPFALPCFLRAVQRKTHSKRMKKIGVGRQNSMRVERFSRGGARLDITAG
jgi:hypothetical protein